MRQRHTVHLRNRTVHIRGAILWVTAQTQRRRRLWSSGTPTSIHPHQKQIGPARLYALRLRARQPWDRRQHPARSGHGIVRRLGPKPRIIARPRARQPPTVASTPAARDIRRARGVPRRGAASPAARSSAVTAASRALPYSRSRFYASAASFARCRPACP